METILFHMMSLLDDSIPYLDAILHDDANLDDLVLAKSNAVLHDVVHDSNIHDEVAHDATLPLVVLSNDDSTLLVGCPQDTPSEVV